MIRQHQTNQTLPEPWNLDLCFRKFQGSGNDCFIVWVFSFVVFCMIFVGFGLLADGLRSLLVFLEVV